MRFVKKFTAMALAVSMVIPTLLGSMTPVYAADTDGAPSAAQNAAEVPETTEYLADHLKTQKTKEAEKLSEAYWETEAPQDAKEAAAMYVEDASDGTVKADASGAGKENDSLKDLDISTNQKKFDENGLRETSHFVKVTYTLANEKYLKVNTIDDLFEKNEEAFLTSIVSASPVYESKDSDCYVAFLNYGGLNGLGSRILDAAFVTNAQTSPKLVEDDVVFDQKTGIVYIPKSYYFSVDGTELGYDLQAQLLVCPKLGQSLNVSVKMENDSRAERVLPEGTMSFSAFNTMTFPLFSAETAKKVSFEDIEVYVNDSALPMDLKKDEEASYDGRTGEYTLNFPATTVYSVKFVVKGKSLAEGIKNQLFLEVRAANGVTGATMSYVTNVDTGKPITPKIEADKLTVGDVFEYNGANSSHKKDAIKQMLNKGQKNFVYAPYLPDGVTESKRQTFYNYLTAADAGEDAKSLNKLIEKLGSVVAAKDQNPQAGGGSTNPDDDKYYWYMFTIGAPSGTLKEIGGKKSVSFGSVSEWNWSDTYLYNDSTSYRHEYVGMCCHSSKDLVDSKKKNQVSVLEKGAGYVVLGLAQTEEGSTSDAQAGATIIKVMTSGKLKLKKESAVPAITQGNNCYSLAGAQYTVYTDRTCASQAAVLTTDASGNSNEVELPAGTYWVKETKAPKGYISDEAIHPITVTAGNTATLSVKEKPGGDPAEIRLKKLDAVTGEAAQGGATLEGAEFTIRYYDGYYTKDSLPGSAKRTWVIKTLKTEDGMYEASLRNPECKVSGDDYYYDTENKICIPLGTISIQETKAPKGYKLEGSYFSDPSGKTVRDGEAYVTQITQETLGGEVHLDGGNKQDQIEFQVSDEVIRGDISLRKIDAETQKKMAGVEFRITNEKTGEAHSFVTDENGEYSTESSFIKHSHNTNGGKAGDGIWFGQAEDGSSATVNDAAGALPYGSYQIEEIEGENNKGKVMFKDTFVLNRDGYTIGLSNVENHDSVTIGTTAKDAETGTHYSHASESVSLADTVFMENLTKNKAYRLDAELVDAQTGEAVKDADGNPVTASRQFTARTSSMTITVELPEFDARSLKGRTVVFFETLTETDGEKVVAEHKDLNDTDQMVYFPGIQTNAEDAETMDHIGKGDDSVTIRDTVTYTNLQPGKTYEVSGVLMSKKTGEPAKDDEGKEIRSSASFKAEKSDGSVTVTFTFSGLNLRGDSLVAFETLTCKGKVMATHEDIDDPDQTVQIPKLGTSATVDGNKYILADKETATVTDTVAYENLIPGKEYTLTGSLMDQKSGRVVALADEELGKTLSFIPVAADGTVTMEFEVKPEAVKGKTLVAFEELSMEEHSIAEHKDLTDAAQTVYVPEIGTTAQDDQTKSHVGSSTKLTDVVDYKGLCPGASYLLKAALMDKETGELLKTAERDFVPEASEGSVSVSMEGAEDFAGMTYVFYEELYLQGETGEMFLTDHKDLSDEGQSIHYPLIGTKAIDGKTKDQMGAAGKEATIVDTVEYRNLIPGQEYTLRGILMDQETGKPFTQEIVKAETEDSSAKDNKEPEKQTEETSETDERTASVTFTPEEADGSVELTYTLDAQALQGKTLVVFEDLLVNGVVVTSHANIEDEDQSVYYPDVKTTAVDTKTQEHVSQYSQTATITDRVEYTNLLAGHTYTVSGKLMDQSTGKPLLDKDGKEHIASVTFRAGMEPGYETLTAADGSEYFHVLDGIEGAFYFKKAADGSYISCDQYGADVEMPVTATEEQVKAEKKVEGKTVSGSVDLVYTVDATLLEGKTVVVFEDLYYEEVKLATHSDIKDEAQSVHVPKIKTSATVNGKHKAKVGKKTKIVDEISYENLVPGLEYTVTGTLMDKKTGKMVEAEVASVTFKPEQASGKVSVEFRVDTSDMNKRTLVAFEELSYKGTLVAQHKDLKDKDQSVTFRKNVSGPPVQTGDYFGIILILLAAGLAVGAIGFILRKRSR